MTMLREVDRATRALGRAKSILGFAHNTMDDTAHRYYLPYK